MSARQYEAPIFKLAERFDSIVLCPEYRLATIADAKFPAALQDAVSAYAYLLNDMGVPPASITFCGDSAGGHLVISLLRYITDNPSTGLPFPAAAMLWSPWTDLSRNPEFIAEEKKSDISDMLPTPFGLWAIREFRGDVPTSDQYISPLQSPFHVPIPLWVSYSRPEKLAFSITAFVASMREKGNQVALYDVPGVPHDVMSVVELLGAWDKYEAALDDALRYLRGTIAA